MKARKLPKSVQAYFFLFGLFIGQVIGLGCVFAFMFMGAMGSLGLTWFAITMGLWGIWAIITHKYKQVLAKWGIIEGEKRDAKTD